VDWSFLQTIDWTQFGKWGAIIGLVVFLFRDKIPAVQGLIASKVAGVEEDPDVADLTAIKRLEARAERRGCQKLAEAVSVVETNFFNKAAK
jgi:hypothetical protein